VSESIDPQHQDTRNVLRVIGPAIAVVGIIFTVIGLGSFFASFGSFEPPTHFWCAFIGLPLVGVGAMISKFAFLGAVSRYVSNEVAPVGKDVVNYMAHGTKDAVREIASAVGQGLGTSGAQGKVEILRCHKCNAENEGSANFCKACGAALAKTKPCAGCGELNDPDARFCDSCGQPMAP